MYLFAKRYTQTFLLERAVGGDDAKKASQLAKLSAGPRKSLLIDKHVGVWNIRVLGTTMAREQLTVLTKKLCAHLGRNLKSEGNYVSFRK
jgi:hypothetical protein